MKMFPENIITRLKLMLTGGSGGGESADSNDRKRKSVALLDIDAKKRRMTTLSSIPAPADEPFIVSNSSNSRPLLQQNGIGGGGGGFSSTMANARRLSEITDMPPVNHHHVPYVPSLGSVQRTLPSSQNSYIGTSNTTSSSSSGSSRFGASALRPLGRRTNNGPPPRLIPIKYVTSRPSIGGSQSNHSALFRRSEFLHTAPAAAIPRVSDTGGNVSLLTNDFRNLLRSKSSLTPSLEADRIAALDRELNEQREMQRKYESLMKKFIPIANNPPAKGAYDRYTRKSTVNGDIQRSAGSKLPSSDVETLDLTDEEVEEDHKEEMQEEGGDGSDDSVEVVSAGKQSFPLFTTIDPAQLSSPPEREEEEKAETSVITEPVNTIRERFESRPLFRDDIIQNVQQRYGTLFSQRKSLIEQERDRLDRLRESTTVKESEARQKMINYVCSFYKFDVLNESELKEATPEPEDVPLPELTREQLDEMQRKLRAGNQVVMQKFNLPITGNDLVTLQDLNWLNDAVINFYMELLRERSEIRRDQGLPKVYTMNTFFLPQLLKMGYAGVRRWTRKVDLLGHDMIVVPVHVGGIHWCMATIDLRRKTIHYYDSMGAPNNAVLNALEQYLCEESLDKRKAPFDKTGLTKQNMRECPRQKNGSDCGVFSCMFAEYLTRDHAITFDQSNMPYFRKKMTVEIMLGKLLT